MEMGRAEMTLQTATDRELMARVQAGDEVAFGVLYDRLAVRALNVARGVCGGDATLAADGVQEAFLSTWRSSSGYRPELGEVHSWVLGIVRNRCIDALRRNTRHAHQAELVGVAEPADPRDTHTAVTTADAAARLRAQLRLLPAAQRDVIVLAFFGELTHTEIAQQLGVPLGTVKSRIRLGLRRLRTQLDEPSLHGEYST